VLIESGRYGLFVLYAAGSVALGITSAAFGFWMVK
jgi:fluoride ion exporter CrcB/FEX